MLSPDRIAYTSGLDEAAADYEVVRRAIGYIRGHWREQPEIGAIADAAGVTPTELHHLFRRWAGLSPKAFLQALTTTPVLSRAQMQSTSPVGALFGSLRDNQCSGRRPLPWSKADRSVQPLFEDASTCRRAFVVPCKWLSRRKRADSQQHRTLGISELSTAPVLFRS